MTDVTSCSVTNCVKLERFSDLIKRAQEQLLEKKARAADPPQIWAVAEDFWKLWALVRFNVANLSHSCGFGIEGNTKQFADLWRQIVSLRDNFCPCLHHSYLPCELGQGKGSNGVVAVLGKDDRIAGVYCLTSDPKETGVYHGHPAGQISCRTCGGIEKDWNTFLTCKKCVREDREQERKAVYCSTECCWRDWIKGAHRNEHNRAVVVYSQQ